MTAIKSPKPSLSSESLLWQILFVVALLLVARVLWTRTQPERLTTLSGTIFTISGEHLYMSASLNESVGWPQARTLDEPVSIQVQSVYSPQRRTLIQDDSHYAFCKPYTLSMGDGKFYYAVQSRSNSTLPSNVRDPNDIHPGTMRYLGTFLLPSKSVPIPQVTGQTRKKLATRSVPADEVRFRQVSMHGGYLYFALNEKHRSLWATLTNDEAAEGGFTTTLGRFPLDH